METSNKKTGDILNRVECLLCGDSLLETIDYHQKYTLYHCKKCNFQFWFPLEYPGFEFYAGTSYLEKTLWSLKNKILTSWNHRQFYLDKIKLGGQLLDIGFGDGRFLKGCKKRGYTVHGLEVGEIAILLLRTQGIDVYHGTVENFALSWKGSLFDCITFFEVMEHLIDPIGLLEHVKLILKQNGKIVLSVPNSEKTKILQYSDCPPGHFTRWNPSSLENLLRKTNFRVEQIKVQPLTFRYIVGHFLQSDLSSRLPKGRFVEVIKLLLSLIVSSFLWIPLKFLRGKGGYIYAVASKT